MATLSVWPICDFVQPCSLWELAAHARGCITFLFLLCVTPYHSPQGFVIGYGGCSLVLQLGVSLPDIRYVTAHADSGGPGLVEIKFTTNNKNWESQSSAILLISVSREACRVHSA